MRRRFNTLDVFTDIKMAGNPLAVVHDSEGLDTAAMQAIAREFNLAETVFLLPPDDPINTAKIRIFTPGTELPFAGHPTVGTAVLLAELRAPEMLGGAGIVIALEESIGLVKVEVSRRQGKTTRGVFSLPRLPVHVPDERDPLVVAQALDLQLEDIEVQGHRLGGFSAGVPFTIVPLRSLEALARARSHSGPRFEQAFGGASLAAAYLSVRTEANTWRTRMFGHGMGISEDPATGAAAAAFAGAIMAYDKPGDGEHQHIILQGVEMGRPSEIVLTLTVLGGILQDVSIGGCAVRISEGTIDL